MKLFTMGFTQKRAEEFFSKIKANHIELLLDIRLNNNSQLAGFTKGRDLIYFLKELCQAEYVHGEIFAPTKTLLTEYKHGDISWEEYEAIYAQLYSSRCMQKYFQETFGGYSNILLLCSEPTPEKCHRRLLAEWLRSDIEGIEIYHL